MLGNAYYLNVSFLWNDFQVIHSSGHSSSLSASDMLTWSIFKANLRGTHTSSLQTKHSGFQCTASIHGSVPFVWQKCSDFLLWIQASRKGHLCGEEMAFEMDSIHLRLNPRKVFSDSGVDSRTVFLSTANSPADNPIQSHAVIVFADKRATGISLKMQIQLIMVCFLSVKLSL